MIRQFSILAILLGFTLSLQAQTKKYTLKIGDFKELTVAHNVNIRYVQNADSAGYAVYTCSPKDASALTFTNSGNKMKIEVISDEPVTGRLPLVTVYSTALEKATNLGDSTIYVITRQPSSSLSIKVIGNGNIQAPDVRTSKFSAAVEAGSGHIFANGKAKEAKYTLASTGSIEAGQVQAENVKCWTFGTGSIDCHAIETLTVYGASSGAIYYVGNPKIKKRAVGAKLVKVDE